MFAWLATRVVAKYGFGNQGTEAEPKR